MQPYQWATDKSRMGLKLMEKMGWSEGRGLGAKEDGQVVNIKPQRGSSKLDKISGVGSKAENDGGWEAPGLMASGFNDVLARLSGIGNVPEEESLENSPSEPVEANDSRNNEARKKKEKGKEGRGFYERKKNRKNVGTYTKVQLREIFGGVGTAEESADDAKDKLNNEPPEKEFAATEEAVEEPEGGAIEEACDDNISEAESEVKQEKIERKKKKKKSVEKIRKTISKSKKSRGKKKQNANVSIDC